MNHKECPHASEIAKLIQKTEHAECEVHTEQIHGLKESDKWLKGIVWGLALSNASILAGVMVIIAILITHKEIGKALFAALRVGMAVP